MTLQSFFFFFLLLFIKCPFGLFVTKRCEEKPMRMIFYFKGNISLYFSQKMVEYNLYLELWNMLWDHDCSMCKILNLNKDHHFQVTIKPHVSVVKREYLSRVITFCYSGS